MESLRTAGATCVEGAESMTLRTHARRYLRLLCSVPLDYGGRTNWDVVCVGNLGALLDVYLDKREGRKRK